MNRLIGILALTLSVILLGFALSNDASAQQKTLREQLIGSWTLVASDNYAPDGTLRQLLGPNPKGSLILGADGRYAQIQVDPDRPKFKSNNRLTGTPEENTAAVKGATAQFGTWSVDEKEKMLTYKVEGALYPNSQGGTESRLVTLTGDELKYTNPGAAGGRAEVIYRRLK
jgi:hypothetical protein